jgi:hypothetical protein
MRKIIVILFIAWCGLFQLAWSANAPQDSNETFIQGSWRIDGQLPGNGTHRMSWFQQWKFDHGKFEERGYPPLGQSGSYRVLKSDGDKLTLGLYDQQGTFGTKNSELQIIVYREKNQLKIGSNEPFKRTKDAW